MLVASGTRLVIFYITHELEWIDKVLILQVIQYLFYCCRNSLSHSCDNWWCTGCCYKCTSLCHHARGRRWWEEQWQVVATKWQEKQLWARQDGHLHSWDNTNVESSPSSYHRSWQFWPWSRVALWQGEPIPSPCLFTLVNCVCSIILLCTRSSWYTCTTYTCFAKNLDWM